MKLKFLASLQTHIFPFPSLKQTYTLSNRIVARYFQQEFNSLSLSLLSCHL